ncbi:MAG: ParA family protein [Maricaulis sp.]|uniref:ParA family protein n=1 Tax=Maricaulis sp. TaxID=1486257 RepID=UPI001B1D1565|nr:ParA family protein [Maricaulis sp.]MBO6729475.1 ParA family protein [Maricaulis sp.]MBO6846247.1 ParA family protein [Maricaulis sp.]MBO6875876.1 ParA family protein [Maricaulis sp.]
MSDNHARNSAPRVISVANQKGGVGKTTTAINLGTALAAIKQRVVIIDLDPQGNASTGLGVPPADRQVTAFDILVGDEPLQSALTKTVVPGLQIVPSDVLLSGAELELANDNRRSYRLKRAIEAYVADANREGIDYILIDCPPSLNVLTVNALTASDAILVPLQCEFFALEGLTQLLKTVERVRGHLNAKLDIQGLVLTMYDSRNNLSAEVAADVREHFGEKVYKTVIPRNVRVSEAPSMGKPVLLYDLSCAGSKAYVALAKEVVRQERKRKSEQESEIA